MSIITGKDYGIMFEACIYFGLCACAPPIRHAKQKKNEQTPGVIISLFIMKWKMEEPHTGTE